MNTRNRILMVLLCIFAITSFVSAQEAFILTPGLSQQIASNDTALITWKVYPRKQEIEYRVDIKSFFDDEIKSFATRDTFLIIPPDFAIGEHHLLIRIIIPNDHGYRNQVVLHRKDFTPATEIVDGETCNARITELLQRGMYPSAYFVYHRHKSIFQLTEYEKIFSEIEDKSPSRDNLKIVFKKGKPFVEETGRTGTIHR